VPLEAPLAVRHEFPRVFVVRRRALVVVILSARSKPMHSEPIDDNDFVNALAEAL